MVDVSGVGPSRPIGNARDRVVRARSDAARPGSPFQERAPSLITEIAGKMAAEPPAVDHAKVAALRASIAKGDLRIEASRIADILLGTAE